MRRGERRSQLGPMRAVLAALLLICATLLAPNTAQAEEDEQIKLQITAVTPNALGTTGELTISGTARNASPHQIDDVHVQLWRDATGLRNPAALQRASNGQQFGGDLSQEPAAKAKLGDLGPGESRSFQVRASLDPSQAVDQLWLEQPDAAYRVGVEARAGDRPNLIGAQRFLMAHPGAKTNSTVAVLAAISAQPSRAINADGSTTIIGNSLLDELANDLGKLITVAEQSRVNVVIDPMLFDDLAALVLSGASDSQPLNSAQVELANDYLARLERLIDSGRAYRSLYGVPDVHALLAAPDGAARLQQLAKLPGQHKMSKLALLVSPAQGAADDAMLAALAELGEPILVAATNTSDADPAARRSAGGAVEVLHLVGTPAQDSAAQQSQWLAELLVAGLAGVPAVLLCDDPTQLQSLTATSWLNRIDLSTIGTDSAAAIDWQLVPTAPFGDPRPAQAADVERTLQTWAALTEHGEQLPALTRGLLGGIWSTHWDDAGQRSDWSRRSITVLADFNQPGALRMRVPNSVTTSADDNLLPVTVVSSLSAPVQVRVHFDSANPQRIRIPDSEVFQIRPGESTTIRVRPHSQANGSVAITARMQTTEGQDIGEPVEFIVQATQAGRVGWIIIVISGIVLLTTTAWRVRQVRAKQQG